MCILRNAYFRNDKQAFKEYLLNVMDFNKCLSEWEYAIITSKLGQQTCK